MKCATKLAAVAEQEGLPHEALHYSWPLSISMWRMHRLAVQTWLLRFNQLPPVFSLPAAQLQASSAGCRPAEGQHHQEANSQLCCHRLVAVCRPGFRGPGRVASGHQRRSIRPEPPVSSAAAAAAAQRIIERNNQLLRHLHAAPLGNGKHASAPVPLSAQTSRPLLQLQQHKSQSEPLRPAWQVQAQAVPGPRGSFTSCPCLHKLEALVGVLQHLAAKCLVCCLDCIRCNAPCRPDSCDFASVEMPPKSGCGCSPEK